MRMERYDPHQIERRWQDVWASEHTWEVPNPGQPGFDDTKPKNYVLAMLPYPSGEPHVGHLKTYSIGDAIAHFRRRSGFQVIQPMGYDAFGLPAENNAIKTGKHPRDATWASIEAFRRQFRSWGVSIDWTRELSTYDPDYYRWTQWIFLRLDGPEVDPLEFLRDRVVQLAGRADLGGGDLCQEFRDGRALEGTPAGQELVEDHPQAVDVAAAVDAVPLAPGLLGAHVGGRAGQPPPLAESLFA